MEGALLTANACGGLSTRSPGGIEALPTKQELERGLSKTPLKQIEGVGCYEMKLTVIGGAGIRVPLVVNGLFRPETTLAVSELSLFDTDPRRCATVARIAQAMAKRAGGTLRVARPPTLEAALDGASFVVSSIRVGGLAGRVQDETIALEHGLPGQETVGPGGFALAMRTIPILAAYARKTAELAPGAWLINFTNPVGIMAEALIREGLGGRCIGVCDTPGSNSCTSPRPWRFRCKRRLSTTSA